MFSYYNLAEKFDVTAASSQLAQILETGDKVGQFCQYFIVTNARLFFLGDIDIYGDSLLARQPKETSDVCCDERWRLKMKL